MWGEAPFSAILNLGKKLTSQRATLLFMLVFQQISTPLTLWPWTAQLLSSLYSRDFLLICAVQSQRIPSVSKTEHYQKQPRSYRSKGHSHSISRLLTGRQLWLTAHISHTVLLCTPRAVCSWQDDC